MNRLFSTPLAIFFVLALTLQPLLAADRIRIPADPCGPMAALQKAGHSVRLVADLQHKDGTPLLPSEARSAPDVAFFLPADTKPSSEKYTAFLRGETEAFGPPPKAACVEKQKGPSCPEELAAAKETADSLRQQLAESKGISKVCMERLLDSEAERKRQNVPWWVFFLVALASVLLTLLFAAWRYRDQIAELRRELAYEQAVRRQAEADRNQALDQLSQLQARIAGLGEDLNFQQRRANVYEQALTQAGVQVPNVRILS